MTPPTPESETALIAALNSSSRSTPLADQVSDQDLREFVRAAAAQDISPTRTTAGTVRRKRRTSRTGAIAMTASALAFAGIGAAAAATSQHWADWGWIPDPDIVLTFTNPSGETCEMLEGNLTGSPEAVAAARAFYASAAMPSEKAIDEATLATTGKHLTDYSGEQLDTYYELGVGSALRAQMETNFAQQGLSAMDVPASSGVIGCGGQR